MWKFVSGGCHLGSNRLFPCDSQYQNKAGEIITVRSTKERHFKMPLVVDDPAELYALAGVQQIV